MPPKKKLRVIDTNQRKITSMLQQGPELTQDAPASADSESAEPENPSEMPEPPDVDMTETDVLLSLTKHRHKVLIICCTNSRKKISFYLDPIIVKTVGKKQCSTVFKMMGFKIIKKNLLRKP